MNILSSVESETYQRLIVTLRQLKNKNKSLEKECSDLKSELTTASQKKVLLHTTLSNLKANALTDKSKDTENAMMLIKIKELKEEHEESAGKLAELQKILERTVELLCKERKKRRNTETKTTKIVENIKNLSAVAQKLQGDPNQAKKNGLLNQKLEEKRNKWKVTKHQLLTQLQALQSKRDQALEAAHDSQVQIDLRIGLIDELNTKVEKRNQTISKLKSDVQIATDDLEKVQNTLLEKRKEIDQLTIKEDTLKQEIIKSKAAYTNLKSKYEKEREKYNTAKSGLQQLKEGVDLKLSMMRKEAERDLEEKIEPLKEQAKEKDRVIRQLKEKLEEAKATQESTASKLHALENEREKQKKAFQQTRSQFEAKFQAMQKAIGSFATTSMPSSDL